MITVMDRAMRRKNGHVERAHDEDHFVLRKRSYAKWSKDSSLDAINDFKYPMSADDELRMDVIESIKADPQLEEVAGQIGVAAKDGVVALSGIVNSYSKKTAIEDAAQLVPGVIVVACDVQVNVGTVTKGTDFEIAQDIHRALAHHQAVADDRIRIKVDGRWVYLDGRVGSTEEKKSLERLIGQVAGIRGVTSNIAMNPSHLDQNTVKRELISGFRKMATLQALAVGVKVEGNKVTLEGAVRSLREKRDVENIVKNISSVGRVDNRLTVEG